MRAFWITESAQPGEFGLFHFSKILSSWVVTLAGVAVWPGAWAVAAPKEITKWSTGKAKRGMAPPNSSGTASGYGGRNTLLLALRERSSNVPVTKAGKPISQKRILILWRSFFRDNHERYQSSLYQRKPVRCSFSAFFRRANVRSLR